MAPDIPDQSQTTKREPSASGEPLSRIDRWALALQRQTARWRGWRERHRRVVIAGIVLSIAVTGYAAWFVVDILTGLPGRNELRSLRDVSRATTIYDAFERPVYTIPTEYRVEVPLSSISPDLIRAIIAVEDQRFYQHDGIDHVRVAAAAWKDLRTLEAAEGGSTITQQLARQSFLSREKTLRRKLKEAILAEQLEHLYTKDEILELYLNRVYFGDGLYGAEAAAKGFFGKPASALTLAEAALLAGTVRAPSASNPVANMERAIARRNVVLQLMLEQKLIDRKLFAAASAEPVRLRDALRHEHPSGLHFREQVRRQLIEQFGKDRLYEGGLRVYTTINPAMQEAAEAAVARSVRDIEARGARPVVRRGRRAAPLPESGDNRLQAALVALDPATGEVRAIVGGRELDTPGLNRAIQTRRQPGSAFKPFVYATALESGYSPATLINGLDIPVSTQEGRWVPEDEHSTAPSMTIRTALRTSSNRAAVRMLEQVGIARTVSYAERLGIGTLPNVPSLALGSGEVTLLSMTSAYAAFANQGIVQTPTFIRRIEDRDGTVLFRSDPTRRQVLSETTAFLMANMLADVVNNGTAARARRLGFTLPAAGKTGTTNDFADAWFIGFTPKLVAGVWVGFDRPRTIIKNGFAGELAVPLWAQFMKAATSGDRDLWFEPPPGVVATVVCRVSGLLASAGCANAVSVSSTGEVMTRSTLYTEYFARGTEPTGTCHVHAALPYYYQSPLGTVGFEDSAAPVPATSPPPSPAPETPPIPPPTSTTVPPPPAPRPAPPPPGESPAPSTPPAESSPLPPDTKLDDKVDPPPPDARR